MELENKIRIKQMRKECSKQGWALLIYLVVFYASSIVAMIVEELVREYFARLNGVENAPSNSEYAWGYFLAIAIGLILLLIWRKPSFVAHSIFQKGRPMHVDSFVLLLILFVGVQGLTSLGLMITETVLNSYGLSIMEGAQSVSGDTEDFMMFLYVSVGAPIAEELLFRGVLLRPLEKMGKRFAVVVTAILFGLFHGNIVQAPFATIVGLVLGYVAVEYSIGWAMVLHMFNNMIFADTIPRLVPGVYGNILSFVLMMGCLIASVVILIIRRKDIGTYNRYYPNERFCWRAFFSAPGMIAFAVAIAGLMVLSITSMITPLS